MKKKNQTSLPTGKLGNKKSPPYESPYCKKYRTGSILFRLYCYHHDCSGYLKEGFLAAIFMKLHN